MPLALPFVAAALIAQSVSVSIAAAPRVEQFRYRFDNPSTFDTSALVPHFFEQRYDVVPLWFAADARYRIGEIDAATSAGLSLRRQRHGSDIDTFNQPTGDVVTSGTDGQVLLRSWEVRQRLAVPLSGQWSVGLTIGLRHDAADFLPDDRIVTHSLPASTTRTFITDREFTASNVFSFGIDAERVLALDRHWRLSYGAGVKPIMRAQLVVQLPDKYPGVDLTFVAASAGAGAHVAIEHESARWRVGVTMRGVGAWAYRPSAAYTLQSASIAIEAGVRIR